MNDVTIVCLGDGDARILRAIRDGLPVTRSEGKRARRLLEIGLWEMGTPFPALAPDHLTASGTASLIYFDDTNGRAPCASHV